MEKVNLTEQEVVELTGQKSPSFPIFRYRNGRDLSQSSRDVFIIDLESLGIDSVQTQFPKIYQHLYVNVKPVRDQNREKYRRENWWKFGRKHTDLRCANQDLQRYIATVKTAKHRFFVFLDGDIIPDSKLYAVGSDDPFHLGVLSSKAHVVWAMSVGGWLGVGNDSTYNNSQCFDQFPFPAPDESTEKRIAELAERLDAHRKRQQEKNPKLTMTGMYNVLEKLRSGESLTTKDKTIHEQGIVSVLRQIHDDLDAAVFDAYGWPHDLDDEAILQRLVDLNHERAEEEDRGIVRWLRPEFQNPDGATQTSFAGDEETKPAKKVAAAKIQKQPWPKTLPERMVAVQSALGRHGGPADEKQVAAYYTRANKKQVTELLETLATLGNVRQLDDGRFVAAN
ncbi:type IIL restriction-modification enzyme MmeI [Roseiconus lacunae]|uniref:type IIL restriction-modification enzyme MmeI n=1 Tax=Roseiconus lacunae TaxID=2605694 RepID=UPI001E2CB7EE|nr:type IIL restriction-modification enzyme MmeI [Roseiconus lacunae]MCD0461416.1 hypothetical protein [Roseiconus lacunae]